jgi:hypothetical protein
MNTNTSLKVNRIRPELFGSALRFQETRFGYEAQTSDHQHTYLITHNGIDYDLNHYWAYATQGELIARVAEIALALRIARNHYASLS